MTVYNNEGFVEDWPELNTGRYDHGCGHFVNTDNKVVRHIDDKKENTVLRNIVLTMEEGFAVNMRMRTVFHGGKGSRIRLVYERLKAIKRSLKVNWFFLPSSPKVRVLYCP